MINTLARIESDMIAAGIERKRYGSFKELLQEIDDEENDNDWKKPKYQIDRTDTHSDFDF